MTRQRHNYGKRIVDRLDGTWVAYLLNFLAIAYAIDLFMTGFAYLYVNWSKVDFSSPSSLFGSLMNLHTGSPVFALSTASGTTGNHVLILICIGTLALMMPKLRLKKFVCWENLSSLKHGYLYAELFAAFVLAIHELLWYAAYVATGQPNELYILSSPMFDFGLLIIILNVFLRPLKWRDFAFIGLSGLVYVAWYFGNGFEVTVSFAGLTPYFHNLSVNVTEIYSWIAIVYWAYLMYDKHNYEKKFFKCRGWVNYYTREEHLCKAGKVGYCQYCNPIVQPKFDPVTGAFIVEPEGPRSETK